MLIVSTMNKTTLFTTTFSIVMALTVPAMKASAQVPTSNADGLKSTIASSAVLSSSRALVQKLYAARAFQPIFVMNGKLTAAASDLRNAVMAIAPTHGLHAADYWSTGLEAAFTGGLDPAASANVEMQLAKIYVDLASHISVGRLNPQSISRDIKYAKRTFDASALVSGAGAEGISAMVQRVAPQHHLYKAQLQILARLQQIRTQGGFAALAPAKVTLKVGVTNSVVGQMKTRLKALGYPLSNTSDVYDQELLNVIRDVQINNLADVKSESELSGQVSPGSSTTWGYFAVPLDRRIQDVELNLEKLRWLPQNLEARHIFVNLATSHMYLHDPNLSSSFDMLRDQKIANGRPARKTPSMRDETKSVILNPKWGVPTTVFREDKVPMIRDILAKGGQWALQDWFSQKRFTVMDDNFTNYIDPMTIDWVNLNPKAVNFYIVQQPGYDNALGVAKVMLGNPWSIYMHDTNERATVFDQVLREVSSGCLRMLYPRDMVAYLLQGTQWDRYAIDSFVPNYTGETRDAETLVQIPPQNKLPLYTMHLTGNLGDDGVIRFTRDLYSQNSDIASALKEAGFNRTPQ